jgi:hypothetical protein
MFQGWDSFFQITGEAGATAESVAAAKPEGAVQLTVSAL